MESLRKNWAFLAVGAVSLLLGALALLTAMRLRQESPVAPTAPSEQKAAEGSAVPACVLTFDLTLATPTPTPSATPGVSPTNEPSVSPSASPSVSPSSSPSPSVTPGTGGGDPSPTPSPTPSVTPSPSPSPSATPRPSASASPSPSATATPVPTATPGAVSIYVTKSVDHTAVNPGDLLNYTVRVTNNGSVAAYDGYFDENLSDYTDYDGGMSCNKTTSSGTSSIGWQIDDLTTSVVQSVSETSSLDQFRVAGSLDENNNNWDLNPGEYITCTYRVRVLSNAPANTSITNSVITRFDNKNGDQTNETESSSSANTSVITNRTQCNQTCVNNSQCGSYEICYIPGGQTSGVCRNPSCVTDGDCVCNFIATPIPTSNVVPQVPVAGTSWPTIALIAGALLLITIGFAL